jgi:hypothetical protein
MGPAQINAEIANLNDEWQRSGHFGDLWGRSAATDAAIRETNDPPLYGPAVAEVQAPASGVEWSETRPTASSP